MGWPVFRGEGLGGKLVSRGDYFPREGMTFAKVPKAKEEFIRGGSSSGEENVKQICKQKPFFFLFPTFPCSSSPTSTNPPLTQDTLHFPGLPCVGSVII